MKGRQKGSLTVEAVISFTVFTGFGFLLLTLVKLVLVMMILNNVTVETAKTIAVSAYPISFINEAQGNLEKMEKNLEPANIQSSLQSAAGSAALAELTGGNPATVLKSGAENMLKGLIGGTAAKLLKGTVYEIKGETVHYLCGLLVQAYTKDCGITFDPEKMTLRVAKIPETEMEFKTLHKEALPLSEDGSVTALPSSTASGTDGQFNAEDVVICLEYPYEIALPLLPSFTVTLRSVSVEHAWTNGTATGPKRTEGIVLDDLVLGKNKTIWIPTGGNGKRFHKEDCKTLWSSKMETTVIAAKQQGFTACKICNPEG